MRVIQLAFKQITPNTEISFPIKQIEDFVHASRSRINQTINPRAGYTLSPLDPQVDDVSPDFVDSQHPAAYPPPGAPGAYHPIPDTRL